MIKQIKSSPKRSNSHLFFVEMIIVLLFFVISCAVVMNMFVHSDKLSRESERLEKMTFCSQSAAEIYSETGSTSKITEMLFGISTEENKAVNLKLDNDFSVSEEGALTLELIPENNSDREKFTAIEIRFSDNTDRVLYSVKAAHIPMSDEGMVSGNG